MNSMAASWVTVGGGRFASFFLPLRNSVELVRRPRARKRVGRLVPSESTFDFGFAVRCSFGCLRGLVPRLWLTLARPGLVLGSDPARLPKVTVDEALAPSSRGGFRPRHGESWVCQYSAEYGVGCSSVMLCGSSGFTKLCFGRL